MTYLGDYIGYLMSEITNARAQADYEAVKIAEQYAKDPYMQHLPIPRFRMPTVTLDVPIVINNIEEPEKGQYSNDRILSYMQAKLKKVLPTHLGKYTKLTNQTSLTTKSSLVESINRQTNTIIEDFKQLNQSPIRITYVTDKIVAAVTEGLMESSTTKTIENNRQIEELGDELRLFMYSEFSKYLRDQPRLAISASTAEVKNAGTKDVLAYLHFTITEEAFEWSTTEENKIKSRRLVPE